MISGTVKLTSNLWLPVLSGMAPFHLRLNQALMLEYKKASNNLQISLKEDLRHETHLEDG